jgi:hypothetical protein
MSSRLGDGAGEYDYDPERDGPKHPFKTSPHHRHQPTGNMTLECWHYDESVMRCGFSPEWEGHKMPECTNCKDRGIVISEYGNMIACGNCPAGKHMEEFL